MDLSRIQLKGYDYFVAVNDCNINNNIGYILELDQKPDVEALRKKIQTNVIPHIPMLNRILFNHTQFPYMEHETALTLERHVYEVAATDVGDKPIFSELIKRPFSEGQPLWRLVLCTEQKNGNGTNNYLLLVYNHIIGDASLGIEFLSLISINGNGVISFGKKPEKKPFRQHLAKSMDILQAFSIKNDPESPVFTNKSSSILEKETDHISVSNVKTSVTTKAFYESAKRLGVSQTSLTAGILSGAIRAYLTNAPENFEKRINTYFSLSRRDPVTPFGLYRREKGNYFCSGEANLFLGEKNTSKRLFKINKRMKEKGAYSAETIFRLINVFSHLPKSLFLKITGPTPRKAFDMSFLPFFSKELSILDCRVKNIFFHVNGHESGSCFYLHTYNGKISLSLTNMDGSIKNPKRFIKNAEECLVEIVNLPAFTKEPRAMQEIMDYFKKQPIFR